ncbi:MAG: malonyl-ACP O-methyltransferase BioC [Agarilytica sp.]
MPNATHKLASRQAAIAHAGLNTQLIPAENTGSTISNSLPLVMLHGWGNDLRSWQPLVDQFRGKRKILLIDLPGFGKSDSHNCSSLDETLNEIRKSISVLASPCHIVGWSLGGMLGALLTKAYPQLVASLTTIGSNAKFVMSEEWPWACEESIFDHFLESFDDDITACRKRFMFLQAQGDKERKKIQRFFQSLNVEVQAEQKLDWRQSLLWLDEIDNRNLLSARQFPCLAIFGESDALVPLSVANEFSKKNLADKVIKISDAGHAPHISQSELVAEKIELFLTQIENPFYRDKKEVARSFSKAAKQYEKIAELQSGVAKTLCAYKKDFLGDICDLGCGTGFTVKELLNPRSEVVALDIATGMLDQCRGKTLNEAQANQLQYVCGDYETLPFADNSFDGIVSSMSFQWASQLNVVLAEARRALKPGGWLLFSTLGPGTLHELKQAWQSVDHYVHVNAFLPRDKVKKDLENSGFVVERIDAEHRTLFYQNAIGLMRELKGIGAHNVNAGKKQSVTTKGQLQTMAHAYESFRQSEGLPASYEVYYVLARVPVQ